VEVYRDLAIIFVYSNIGFTDKQKEDLPKLYDILKSSGIIELVISAIPQKEYESICNGIVDSIDSVYKYQNSVLGVLDTIKSDYQDTEFSLENIQELIQSTDLSTVQEIISKLG
jgi:hypothetical protein